MATGAHRTGAGVGECVEGLLGIPVLENKKVYRFLGFLGFKDSWFLGFLVSQFLGLLVVGCLVSCLLVSWFLGFRFLGFSVSWFMVSWSLGEKV